MADLCNILHSLKPVMAMLLGQLIAVGQNFAYKLAIVDGMNMQILVAYRCIFATIFIAPIAYFVEKNNRPKLTWMVIMEAFFGGLFAGPLSQNLYVACIKLTSVTFTTALTNLIPAVTFIIGVALGLERLGFRTTVGKAKLAGTIVGIGGAMVLTFYKGIEINIWSTNVDLTDRFRSDKASDQSAADSNYVLGSILGIASCLSSALWLIVQGKMSEIYPCSLSMNALMCIMGSIQSIIYAFCIDRKWKDWKLAWNIRLWTVAYLGIVGMGFMYTLVAWSIKVRGPLFVSVFTPLSFVGVAILASLLLNEKLRIGSVIGAVLIVMGLYAVVWGKHKERKKMDQISTEPEQIEVVINSPIVCSSPATTGTSIKKPDI